MKENVQITASIVLHNEKLDELAKAVNSFLSIPQSKKLFLIDNSLSNRLQDEFQHPEVEYILNNKNLGFGKAHNRVLEEINGKSKYHLILNPDVSFETHVIVELIKELEVDENLSIIAPKVVFSNGTHQYSCRRYPTLYELLARRFKLSKNIIARGEYNDKDLTKPFHPDFLQGCFQLFKTQDFIRIGGFDERYFLYMEDVDICRKIDQIGKKKLYYPFVQITHILKKGSSKNIGLFLIHLNSSIKYFKKWGF